LSSNLRILLDESVTDVLAQQLRAIPSLNVEYCRDLPIKGASDPEVIAYAKRERRIVITTETAMNHKTFPVCTHPGIIVLAGKHRHESIHEGNFKRFLLSGHRTEARDAVTFISEREMRVKSHSGEQTIVL
jgi:predicted nuclease of predicted toxin-antitoxin system